MEKPKTDEMLNIIKNELQAILAEEEKGNPARGLSYDKLMESSPLSKFAPNKGGSKSSTTAKITEDRQPGERLTSGQKGDTNLEKESIVSANESSLTTSKNIPLKSQGWTNLEKDLRVDFMDSQAAKNIDADMLKMQVELKKSYELFQNIGEKLESINFSGLRNRIRDLNLQNMNNDMGKTTTLELQQVFENSFVQNRLDKLTSDVKEGFRRHPGEFGDIPELSTFFQACTQLEHGLNELKQQRHRSNELEKRLCWATEIAYDRMDEIRSAVGNEPDKNF